jgi:hypothetical protein
VEISMKNFILIPILFTGLLFSCSQKAGIYCESITDCPNGYYCNAGSNECVRGLNDGSVPDDYITNNGNNTNNDSGTDADGDIDGDLPLPDGGVVEIDGSVPHCSYVPPIGVFDPQMECRWNTPVEFPTSNDVVMTPVVANLTDDNGDGVVDTRDIPDIAFISYNFATGCCNSPGVLRVVSGKCGTDGHTIAHFSVDTPVLDNSGGVAIGDITGDGTPEIVAMTRSGGCVAYTNDGTVIWQSIHPQVTSPAIDSDHYTGGQPAIDDLDGDGVGEVIIGRVVLDGLTGALKWRGVAGKGTNGFMGPMSFSADIDLDGRKEVIAGNTVYRADGMVMWTFEYPYSTTPCQGLTYGCDGFSAAGNFDSDPYAEIVIVRSGDLWILEHTGELMAHIAIPTSAPLTSYNEGGAPTIADFDGDLKPEIGVAGAYYYVVFDLDCCETLPDCTSIPVSETYCISPGVRWQFVTDDNSSRVTGSSVFDFDGDGKAEIVYNDEVMFRILSVFDSTPLYSEPNTSHTRLEYPIIVDVDNDGNAEIIFIENSKTDPVNNGIEIWGDLNDRWVPTRRIWNQHSYYISHINEDGSLPPAGRVPNWLNYNNFRQNLPDYNVFAAPDLEIEIIEYDKSNCNSSIDVVIEVCNTGDLRVGSGVSVGVWDNEANAELTCATPIETTMTLEPTDCEIVICVWNNPPGTPDLLNLTVCADNELPLCMNGGSNNECIEDNNSHSLSEQGCDGPIGK